MPDMHAMAEAMQHDHKTLEQVVLGSLVAVFILLAVLLFVANRNQRHVYGTIPTPTPISAADVNGMLPALRTALSEADANLTGLDNALNDQQGSLSE